MKLTTKGIGWLIFGVLLVASSTEASGLMATLSTIVWGLFFIGIYVMRQFFKPHGIFWYIGGSTLLSFCVESGANSDTLIAMVIGVILMGIFYINNEEELRMMMDGIVSEVDYNDPLEDFSYVDEDTYPDPSDIPNDIKDEVSEPDESSEEPSVEFEIKEDE